MTDWSDATLDEIRAGLAPGIAANAGFDGWTPAARDLAADALGIDRDIGALALPDAPAMIDAWFLAIDAAMAELVPTEALATMKIRQRIARQVEARLELAALQREALRRALAILALPTNLTATARLSWRTVDLIWRRAGDTATDYNHYTKRTILLGVYAATVTVFLNDESDGFSETRAFLDRRIDGILQFEKVKAAAIRRRERLPSLSRFVGRLRYPVV